MSSGSRNARDKVQHVTTSRIPMSSPNYPLVLSDQAQADYEDILSVTLLVGRATVRPLRGVAQRCVSSASDDPSLGHRSRQLPARYRLLHVGRHLILYRFTEGMVYVVRILHDRMDVRQRIAESEEPLDDDDN